MRETLIKIHGIEEPERFFNPTSKELHDPYLLKNIDLARNRILKAIHENEKISIYADVDFDGCASCTIMYRYLKHFTDNVTYFHAQRSDGHGIIKSKDNIPDGTQLLIIVDSSSDEPEICREIRERGIDIVILDHHLMSKVNDHCILVNPNQKGCTYPNKFASGSLVAWKMCQVLDETLGEELSWQYVDLAGTGVYSDQMSMLEYENRFVVREALDNINNLGLRMALEVMGKTGELSTSDIGFSIIPYVNAATRMDKMEIILELLTEDDPTRAMEIAQVGKELNEKRKKIQKAALKRIIPTINPDSKDKCTVIIEPELGRGFNGLIAGDLVNIFQRPFVVLGVSEENPDEFHGSFRSVGFFKFLDYVQIIPESLFSGGHQGAGGCGIKKTDIDKFKKSLNEGLENQKFEQSVTYELDLDSTEITEELINEIKPLYRLAGKNFYEARFLIKNLIALDKKALGDGDTLKVFLYPESKTIFWDEEDYKNAKPEMNAMKFKVDDSYIKEFPVRESVEIIGTLNVNTWSNKYKPNSPIVKTNQIYIEDYRISQ